MPETHPPWGVTIVEGDSESSGRQWFPRAWVLVVLTVGIVAVTVLGVLVVVQDETPPSGSLAGEAPQISPSSSSSGAEAQEVAKALEAGAGDPSRLVASGSTSRVDDPSAALPEGTTLTVHADTWKPDGVGGGLMQVTVARPGKPDVDYTAVMVQEAGTWKVLATLPTVNAP